MSRITTRPDFIGAISAGGIVHFYGASAAEIDRGAFAIVRVLRSFRVAPHSTILTVSTIPEIVQYGAFERAIQMLGMLGINADDSPFDAGRVESISRQFEPPAICGVSAATIDGLRALGHDPAQCFAGRTVWARPNAYKSVLELDRVDARQVVSIGPALALECAEGSLHYDSREWSIHAVNGTLRISSRHERSEPLVDFDTLIDGEVIVRPCRCGAKDGAIRIA